MIPQQVRDLIRERYESGQLPSDMTPETFRMYVPDLGGWDCSDDVALEFVKDRVYLVFKDFARFELRFVV